MSYLSILTFTLNHFITFRALECHRGVHTGADKGVLPKCLIIYHNSVSICCRTFACLHKIQISTFLFEFQTAGLSLLYIIQNYVILHIILH